MIKFRNILNLILFFMISVLTAVGCLVRNGEETECFEKLISYGGNYFNKISDK